MAINLDVRPMSELIIFALAIAIERLFFAPLSRNATPSLILLVGLDVFFIIFYIPLDRMFFEPHFIYRVVLNFL